MAAEKPLSEKKDYYSLRRKAFQDVMHWIDEGLNEKEIELKLLLRYGFTKNIYYKVLDLTKENKKEKK